MRRKDIQLRYIVVILLISVIVISGGYLVIGRPTSSASSATAYISICLNSQPNITATNCSETATAGALYHCYINASDGDQHMLNWSDDTDLFNITNDTINTSIISWTPTLDDVGSYTVNITIMDTVDCYNSDTYWLNFTVSSVCGDDVCSADETHLSCPEDCSAPTTPVETIAGGGGSMLSRTPAYMLSTAEVNLKVLPGQVSVFNVSIKNNIYASKNITITVSDSLEGIVVPAMDTIFLVSKGERPAYFTVYGPIEPGVYTGLITFEGSTRKSITVTIEVESAYKTFETTIELDKNKLTQGDRLSSLINLRFFTYTEDELFVVYELRDINSTTIYSENETREVDGELTFKKRIVTSKIDPGLYFFIVSAYLDDEVASDSDTFTLYARREVQTSEYMMVIGTLGGALVVFWLILAWVGKNKK